MTGKIVSLGWAFLLMLGSVASAQSKPPHAAVPQATTPVQLDGQLSPGEWDDAAVLRRFVTDSQPAEGRNMSAILQPVSVYVKHEKQVLWVAFRCQENDPRYPRAMPRTATGNLSQDDAVQVVLGLADANVVQRDVLNMGGYAGAMGTPAVAADYYYQFTVNAVGSVGRMYNEVPLKEPRFTAAVSKDAQGWTAEMRIPLSSIGASGTDQTLFFNAFRFRPPDMIGWHLPGFGGYFPMPLGQITLLPATAAAKDRTIERPIPAPIALPKTAGGFKSAAIGYYPLSGSIVGTIQQEAPFPADRVTLQVSGLPDKQITLQRVASQEIVLDIPKGSQPARQAKLLVYGQQKLLTTVQRDLHAVAAPEWLGTSAGSAYIREKIPAPWTQPLVDGATISLVDKKIRMGRYGLPESIVNNTEALAGPAQVVVVAGGRTLVFKDDSLHVSPEGNQVRVEASASDGTAHLQSRSLVDYDGFIVTKLRLSGLNGPDISRLALRIPLRKEVAQFYHKVLVQQAGQLDGSGYESPASAIWTGNQQAGLAFSYDVSPFVSTESRRQVRLIEESNQVWMELNFVDAAGQLSGRDPMVRFFLHPTPTKPMDLQKIHPRVSWMWEDWSDYQGYPDLTKIPTVKSWAEKLHASGQLGVLYTCQGLAENSPDFKTFAEDLMMKPSWIFYRRGYDPGRNVPCFATCKRGPEGDLQLWAFEKLVKEAKIDGMVSDGLSMAWNDQNPGHADGCGRTQHVMWDSDQQSQVVAQRTFLKRMRGIFNESGRPFYMAAHCGGGLEINTLSFFDGYMEGEQLCRYPRDYPIPLASYVVGYSGQPWGLRTIFWEKTWRRFKGFYWSLTYALLHDNEFEDSMVTRLIYTGFDDRTGTEYFPYWRPSKHLRAQSKTGESKVSYYRRNDSALVIVGNLGLEQDSVTLELGKLLPSDDSTVTELISGQTIALSADKACKVDLLAGKCVALRIQPRSKPAAAGVKASGDLLAGWALTGGKNGVGMKHSTLDSHDALKLTSTLWADEARMEYAPITFESEGYASLLVRHSGRLRLVIGKASLYYDNGWQMAGFMSGMGTLYQPAPALDRTAPIQISIQGGRADITYDGKILARGLMLDPGQPSRLAVATWAGDNVELAVLDLSTQSQNLFVPGLESTRLLRKHGPATAPATDLDLSNDAVWSANLKDDGVKVVNDSLGGKPALKLESTPYKAPAQVELKAGTMGRNGTLVLALRFNERFRLKIGQVNLLHDPFAGNGWNTGSWSISGPLDGWSSGMLYQLPPPADKEAIMAISLRDGVLDVTLGGKVLVRQMAYDLPDEGNAIVLETWAGNSFTVRGISMSAKPQTIVVPRSVEHPIR